MFTVNFIDWRTPYIHHRRQALIKTLCFYIVLIILCFSYWQRSDYKKKERKQQQWQQQINTQKTLTAQLKTLHHKKNQLTEKYKQYNLFIQKNAIFSHFVDTLTFINIHLPTNIWLVEIAVTKEHWIIKGYSLTEASLYQFQQHFSRYLKQPVHVEVNHHQSIFSFKGEVLWPKDQQ